MRCLSLASALRQLGWGVEFVSRPDGTALSAKISADGFPSHILPEEISNESEDAESFCQVLTSIGCPLAVVVDHYQLGADWERRVRQRGVAVLAIDDLVREHSCDLLLDQNVIDSERTSYADRTPTECRLLLGPQFALLRPEFARLRKSATVRQELRRILIFFGGSDPGNETGKALEGILTDIGDWKIDVVVGKANPHLERLRELCARRPNSVTLHVQTDRMAELMLSADLAIGAAGSAAWERCCLRLPAVSSVLAENQVGIARTLHRLDALHSIGLAVELRPEDYAFALEAIDNMTLRRMSNAAGEIVDGDGASRVASELEHYLT